MPHVNFTTKIKYQDLGEWHRGIFNFKDKLPLNRVPTDRESNGWWYKSRRGNQYKRRKITAEPGFVPWVGFLNALKAQAELSNHLKLPIRKNVKDVFLSFFLPLCFPHSLSPFFSPYVLCPLIHLARAGHFIHARSRWPSVVISPLYDPKSRKGKDHTILVSMVECCLLNEYMNVTLFLISMPTVLLSS